MAEHRCDPKQRVVVTIETQGMCEGCSESIKRAVSKACAIVIKRWSEAGGGSSRQIEMPPGGEGQVM